MNQAEKRCRKKHSFFFTVVGCLSVGKKCISSVFCYDKMDMKVQERESDHTYHFGKNETINGHDEHFNITTVHLEYVDSCKGRFCYAIERLSIMLVFDITDKESFEQLKD